MSPYTTYVFKLSGSYTHGFAYYKNSHIGNSLYTGKYMSDILLHLLSTHSEINHS